MDDLDWIFIIIIVATFPLLIWMGDRSHKTHEKRMAEWTKIRHIKESEGTSTAIQVQWMRSRGMTWAEIANQMDTKNSES